MRYMVFMVFQTRLELQVYTSKSWQISMYRMYRPHDTIVLPHILYHRDNIILLIDKIWVFVVVQGGT